MSHKTYITEAVVCGSSPSNTSDKTYLLFSKDAGMIFAHAQSVREERSKQRYALQEFSIVRVTLVRGKHIWRIGSVEALGNPFMGAKSREERGFISSAVAQLRRYVHGEEPLLRVFDDTVELLLSPQKNLRMQQLFQLRLLSELGYIVKTASFSGLLEAKTLKDAVELHEQNPNADIEEALHEATQASQL